MAYNKKKLFTKAMKAIASDDSIVFVEDVVCEIGCSKQTLYDLFPIGSDEMDEIKEALQRNKSGIKRRLRKNWLDPDSSASTQIALYKLIAGKDELERLNNDTRPKEQEAPTIKIENYIPLKGGSDNSD